MYSSIIEIPAPFPSHTYIVQQSSCSSAPWHAANKNSRCSIEVNTAACRGILLHKNILYGMELLIGISFILPQHAVKA